MPVTLRVVTAADRPLLDRLAQLYVYDFSEMLAFEVGADGTFLIDDQYVELPAGRVWIVEVDGHPAGFVRVLAHGDEWKVDQFFVVRKHRRGGVGKAAAQAAFAELPGSWWLTVRPENAGAERFWERALVEYDPEKLVSTGRDGQPRILFRFRVR